MVAAIDALCTRDTLSLGCRRLAMVASIDGAPADFREGAREERTDGRHGRCGRCGWGSVLSCASGWVNLRLECGKRIFSDVGLVLARKS